MPFEHLMKDRIRVVGLDGAVRGPIPAAVSEKSVSVFEEGVSFDEGEVVERDLPGGKVERLRITNARFNTGIGSIPGNWKLEYEKLGQNGQPLSNRSSNSGSIVISNSQNVQVGHGNVQTIQSGISALIDSINLSGASDAEKKEAKSRIAKVLEHPIVVGAFGAVAAVLADRLK